jgi:hypothetical protein
MFLSKTSDVHFSSESELRTSSLFLFVLILQESSAMALAVILLILMHNKSKSIGSRISGVPHQFSALGLKSNMSAQWDSVRITMHMQLHIKWDQFAFTKIEGFFSSII